MGRKRIVHIDLGEHSLSEFTDGEGADGTKTIASVIRWSKIRHKTLFDPDRLSSDI